MAPYARMTLGILNLVQLLLGPTIFFLVTTSSSQRGRFVVLRVDALFMVWVSGTFFTLSLFLYACCTLDNTLPLRTVYRTTVATATLGYVLCSILFTSQELTQGRTVSGRIASGLSIINCFSYIASAVIAYQPVLV
ncbi:uncharacterized protein LOC144152147 [Haemaphysalis longicornis]